MTVVQDTTFLAAGPASERNCSMAEDGLMADEALHALLRDAEGARFRFTFTDGQEMLADVVSATHVDADDTVVLLRAGASAGESAWQVHFANIRSVAAPDGRWLYNTDEPVVAPARPA